MSGKTILLVEDTPDLLETMRQLLEAGAYRVLCANDGGQALEKMQGSTGPIELLITDLTLPDMTGADVAAWGIQIHPEMKVLFISGAGSRGALVPDGSVLLQKPFPGKELLRLVAQLTCQNPSMPRQ